MRRASHATAAQPSARRRPQATAPASHFLPSPCAPLAPGQRRQVGRPHGQLAPQARLLQRVRRCEGAIVALRAEAPGFMHAHARRSHQRLYPSLLVGCSRDGMLWSSPRAWCAQRSLRELQRHALAARCSARERRSRAAAHLAVGVQPLVVEEAAHGGVRPCVHICDAVAHACGKGGARAGRRASPGAGPPPRP